VNVLLENQKVGASLVRGFESVEGAIVESGLESGGRLTERVESRNTFLERTESFKQKKRKEKRSFVFKHDLLSLTLLIIFAFHAKTCFF
jgi:hypothetical protein